jgi:hypothetical protein
VGAQPHQLGHPLDGPGAVTAWLGAQDTLLASAAATMSCRLAAMAVLTARPGGLAGVGQPRPTGQRWLRDRTNNPCETEGSRLTVKAVLSVTL